jgi:hypothetical protein
MIKSKATTQLSARSLRLGGELSISMLNVEYMCTTNHRRDAGNAEVAQRVAPDFGDL